MFCIIGLLFEFFNNAGPFPSKKNTVNLGSEVNSLKNQLIKNIIGNMRTV